MKKFTSSRLQSTCELTIIHVEDNNYHKTRENALTAKPGNISDSIPVEYFRALILTHDISITNIRMKTEGNSPKALCTK